MPLCVMTLSYDGTGLSGWQVQPGRVTVQGLLAQALREITGEAVLPQGSGRTDAGVHALGQVASVRLASPIPAERLHRALNRKLPAAVRVLRLRYEEGAFHARHSAREKTYLYRILPAASQGKGVYERGALVCSPFLATTVWAYPGALCLEALQEAAARVVGTHDFSSFAARARPDRVADADYEPTERMADYPEGEPTAVRTIVESTWRAEEHTVLYGAPVPLLVYRVTGSGFLHHMVRNLVGTFVQVGAGRLRAERVTEILAARDRSLAGPTAPARGLFLAEVRYR